MYGGNTTNFNLPNLCGRFPIGQCTNPVNGVTTVIGSVSDTKQASLTSNNVPQPIHPITSSATVTGGAVCQ
jgi:microcystin-dependent protein